MHNPWSIKTLELVRNQNYLDQLQQIYPHEDGVRDVPQNVLDAIRTSYDDGISLATNTSGGAVKIFILDGIYWIESGSDQYKRIDNSTVNIFSAILLEEFLMQLQR